MNVALVNGLDGLDGSEFVTASPINVTAKVKRGVRFNAGFNVKPDARAREYKVPKTETGESAVSSEENAALADGETAAVSPSRIQKAFRILFFVCVIFFAAELAWLFLITPMRPLSSVVITGIENGSLEKSEIARTAGIGAKTSYLSFDTKAAEKNLAGIPAVESAKVVKHFPGTARITIVLRNCVALFLRNVNGKIVPVHFDRHGVVFKQGGESGGLPPVPVISGLETAPGPGGAPIGEGERLPSVYIPLFENLDRLSSASPALYEAISEIEVNKKTYDGFDVTLFPSQSPVKIRMNADLDEETIGRAFLLLDVLEAKGVRVSEIDYRAGMASYIIKEVDD
jgi:cell division protein FtsQ